MRKQVTLMSSDPIKTILNIILSLSVNSALTSRTFIGSSIVHPCEKSGLVYLWIPCIFPFVIDYFATYLVSIQVSYMLGAYSRIAFRFVAEGSRNGFAHAMHVLNLWNVNSSSFVE